MISMLMLYSAQRPTFKQITLSVLLAIAAMPTLFAQQAPGGYGTVFSAVKGTSSKQYSFALD